MSAEFGSHRLVRVVWYMCRLSLVPGRYVDWLQLLSSTSVGVFSLVGVSAEFGNLRGMLIG